MQRHRSSTATSDTLRRSFYNGRFSGSFVSVAQFGAAGDGTDQTEALQRAFDYAGALEYGCVLHFPPGDYVVSSSLRATGYISVVGTSNGSRLIVSSGKFHDYPVLEYRGAGPVIVRDLEIHGNGEGAERFGHGLRLLGSQDVALSDVTVEQVLVKAVPGIGLQIAWAVDVQVKRCKIFGCGRDGISIWHRSSRIAVT